MEPTRQTASRTTVAVPQTVTVNVLTSHSVGENEWKVGETHTVPITETIIDLIDRGWLDVEHFNGT